MGLESPDSDFPKPFETAQLSLPGFEDFQFFLTPLFVKCLSQFSRSGHSLSPTPSEVLLDLAWKLHPFFFSL